MHQWRDFPDLACDGFVAWAFENELGIEADPFVPEDLPVRVDMAGMDEVWRATRRTFPGRDRDGKPADMETEDHWDERGPEHVQALMLAITSSGKWPFSPLVLLKGEMVDGRHCAFAARLLGLKHVPVILLEQYLQRGIPNGE